MKRKYIVRWYEYNLTQQHNKRFFTLTCALLFQVYLRYIRKAFSKLYEICAVE